MYKKHKHPLQLIRTRTSGRDTLPFNQNSSHRFSALFLFSNLNVVDDVDSFSLSFGKPTHTLFRTPRVVFVNVVKKHPYLCVCVREEENFTFHSCSRPDVSGVRLELGSRLHDVCSTRRRQSYDIDWARWWNTHRENSIFPVPVSLLLPGAVFCFSYSYSLLLFCYGYNFYNFGFSTAAGGRHICNICRSSFLKFSFILLGVFFKLKLRNHCSILPSGRFFGHLVVGCTCTKNRNCT